MIIQNAKVHILFIFLPIFFVSAAIGQMPSLVSYFPFDANFNDTLGSHDATNHGAELLADGVSGGCVEFVSSEGDYLNLGNVLDLETELRNDFSISLWMKKAPFVLDSTPNNDDFVFSVSAPTPSGEGLLFDTWAPDPAPSDYRVGVHVSGGGWTQNIDYDLVSTNWAFWVVTKSTETGVIIYKNGELFIDSSSHTNPINYSSSRHYFSVGAGMNSNGEMYHFLNGQIDELKIWDGVISSSEVQQLYNAPSSDRVSVSVLVVDENGGAPIEGALVKLFRYGVAYDEEVSGSDGYSHLSTIHYSPLDQYYCVTVEYNGRSAFPQLGEPGLMGVGDIASLTIPVSSCYELKGAVADAFNEQLITGAQVELYKEGSTEAIDTTIETDEHGHFRVFVEESGFYYFKAIKVGLIGEPAVTDTLYEGGTSSSFEVSSEHLVQNLGTLFLESKVVVLVHGIKSNHLAWKPENGTFNWEQELRDQDSGWTVLNGIDLPGQLFGFELYGFATIREQAQYLGEAIEAVGVQSVNIVAHSQGGLVSRYYNEILNQGTPKVNKLIALATPHHGSPVAFYDYGLRLFLIAGTGFSPLATMALWEFTEYTGSFLPALVDLRPNSVRLRQLNQGGIWSWDWAGSCYLDDPNPEVLIQTKTSYATVAGTDPGWSLLYMTLDGLQGPFCWETDGVVPAESARLFNEGPNIHNYLARDIENVGNVHHKDEQRDVVGILENQGIRNWVYARLAQPGSLWPEDSSFEGIKEGENKSTEWSTGGGQEFVISNNETHQDAFAVDSCDSLQVMWSWFDGQVELQFQTPSGVWIDSTYAANNDDVEFLIDRFAKFGLVKFSFPEIGNWDFEAICSWAGFDQNILVTTSLAGASTIGIQIVPVSDEPFTDRVLYVEVKNDAQTPVLDAVVTTDWHGPSDSEGQLLLLDDGMVDDEIAEDGIYSGRLELDQMPGTTSLDVEVFSEGVNGFYRRAFLSIREEQISDVAISSNGLTATSARGLALSPVTLGTSITNNGTQDMDVRVVFSLEDGTVLQTEDLIALGGNNVECEATHFPVEEGVYNYSVTMIPLGSGVDEFLGNNSSSTSIFIGAAVSGVPDEVDGPHEDGENGNVPSGKRVGILTAYPNPFNPKTNLKFVQGQAGKVEVRVFDVRGRLVKDLFSGIKTKGEFELFWAGEANDGSPSVTGVYFVHFRSGGIEDCKKIVLIK